ncbi:hypothetical protein MD484_g5521, partial [Candolleomyces efflorescens]
MLNSPAPNQKRIPFHHLSSLRATNTNTQRLCRKRRTKLHFPLTNPATNYLNIIITIPTSIDTFGDRVRGFQSDTLSIGRGRGEEEDEEVLWNSGTPELANGDLIDPCCAAICECAKLAAVGGGVGAITVLVVELECECEYDLGVGVSGPLFDLPPKLLGFKDDKAGGNPEGRMSGGTWIPPP